ncbi:MAG TPA: hypothetical protein VGR16_06325 [Thermomicrobiales bacterium]|nr:hypothetical protein [Thermomicrobiales bacterium]
MATTFSPIESSSLEGDPAPRPDLITRFGELIDLETGAIGRVVGSEKEPAGAHQFHIWAADEALSLDVGHIVVTFSEEAAVIGVVDEPRRFSDLRTFLDDYYDRHIEAALEEESPTKRPEILVFTVNVLATKHIRDDVTSQRPAVSGPVFFATPAAIDYALGRHDFSGVPIPALMHTNGNAERDDDGDVRHDEAGNVVFQRAPIWLDGDYLLGPEAGHANWTGQSGLATKTSHALFLISSVFQHLRKQPGERQTVAALMFNVKGPDLLWLDKPADPEPGREDRYAAADARGLSQKDHDAYTALGLEPRPFSPFRIFAPFKPNQTPDAHGPVVRLEAAPYRGRLNTLRDASGETEDTVFPILWALEPLLWMPHKVFDRGDLDDKLWGFIYELREQNIGSIAELETLFAEVDAHFQRDDAPNEWHGHHKFTIHKARNRFKSLPSKLGGLLSEKAVEYGHLPRADEKFQDQELRVIDIANCNTNVQELIVTSVITEVWRMAEEEKLNVDKLIIFVDELNKYAPGGGQGALRDTLVDIAARGRHLNVVLFGAQQFRSKVDDEILGNCGTSLYGRVGDEEITNSAYRSLSGTVQDELLGLPKGRLLVRHAHFRAPLFGSFPLPPTVPGMTGQRIFNGGGIFATSGHVADGLITFLRGRMGDKAPHPAEVRAHAEGLTRQDLEDICAKVRQAAAQSAQNNGSNPWSQAKSLIQRRQERNR